MPNINKNIIMQAGAAVANATNKAAGLSAATPEPGSIISSIQIVNGGRKIGPSAIAHFTESVRNKLLSLLVSMEPIQNFNGYGHPWPAGGGVNVMPGSVAKTETVSGVTISTTGDGVYSLSGTASDTLYIEFDLTDSFVIPPSSTHKCLFRNSKNVGGVNFAFYNGTTLVDSWGMTPANRIGDSYQSMANKTCNKIRISVTNGTNATLTISPMFVPQSVPNDVAFTPYANICPITGKTGISVYIGPDMDPDNATEYTADWSSVAGAVYAGSADIVSGDIKAATSYASYNGDTLVGPWVSSMDVYDPEGTPTTGAQVVDLGGTMTEYHITGQDIITLVGDNYIWSDSGDVTITE